MTPPLITLTTDFGRDSSYVAALKGVLLSAVPSARLVDVSHEIPAQSIWDAELLLRSTAFAFPLGAVHVVVVDPGVGTARRPLAVRARGNTFVGPDNGVLGIALRQPGAEVVVIDRAELFLHPVSSTFHGRDIFAPVAAELARGARLADIGSPCSGWVASTLPEAVVSASGVRGESLGADRFGNVLTNVPGGHLSRARRVQVRGQAVSVVRTYGEAAQGALVALIGSDGYVELAVRDGSAAAFLGAARGHAVDCAF